MFVDDLVGEEGSDDCEETVDKSMVLDYVCGDGGDGEELESEVFDGGLCLSVDEQVGIYDAVVDVCKAAS